MDFLIERQDYILFAHKIQQLIDKLDAFQRAEISKVMSAKVHREKITVESISRLALGFSLIQLFPQKPDAKYPTLRPSELGTFTLAVDALHEPWLRMQTQASTNRTIEDIIEQAVIEYTDKILHTSQTSRAELNGAPVATS